MIVAGTTALVALIMLAPSVGASGPNSAPTGPAHPVTIVQDSAWLAAKNHYQIISGLHPNQGKHGKANPTVLANPLINSRSPYSVVGGGGGGEPSSYILYHDWGIEYVAEPGDGQHANLPDGTQYSDDAGHPYNDIKYVTLCGPGAADVAMYWWPYPLNDSTHTVVDHLPGAETKALTWYGEDGTTLYETQAYRQRGYMSYLGFGISNVPGWSGRAMLPQSYYQTGINGGATLQAMNTVMNWEASSETSTSYFYVVTWNNTIPSGQLATYLHNDITTDIASSNVPMVVEVDARQLPNWGGGGSNPIYHFIAITGYDDNLGQYYYFDTCKKFTGCNDGNNPSDTPDLHSISQSQLASAVGAIPTNQSTGDGGWIW